MVDQKTGSPTWVYRQPRCTGEAMVDVLSGSCGTNAPVACYKRPVPFVAQWSNNAVWPAVAAALALACGSNAESGTPGAMIGGAGGAGVGGGGNTRATHPQC